MYKIIPNVNKSITEKIDEHKRHMSLFVVSLYISKGFEK